MPIFNSFIGSLYTFLLSAILSLALFGSIIYGTSAQEMNSPAIQGTDLPYQLTWKQNFPNLNTETVVHNSIIYAVQEQHVKSLALKTGHQIWSTDFGIGFPAIPVPESKLFGDWGFTPLAVTDRLVLLGVSRGDRSHLFAFDVSTGALQWDFDSTVPVSDNNSTYGKILSPPIIWHDRVVFRTGAGLTALKLTDGSPLWNVPLDPTLHVPAFANAYYTTDEQGVYFNSDFGVAYAFDPRDGRRLWGTRTEGFDIKGVLNVHKVRITFSNCQPLRTQNFLFIGDGTGNIYALNAENGSVLWTAKPGYTFQFVALGDRIYAATEKGLMEFDLKTGVSLRQYTTKHIIAKLQIVNGYLLLAELPAGWEIFDLKNWKSISSDPDFSARFGFNIFGDTLLMGGRDSAATETSPAELRAYHLNLSQTTAN